MWSIHAPYPNGSTALNPCRKTTTGSGSMSAARSGEKSQNPVGDAPTRSAWTWSNLYVLPPGPDAGCVGGDGRAVGVAPVDIASIDQRMTTARSTRVMADYLRT